MSPQPLALTTIEEFGRRLRAREITAEQALTRACSASSREQPRLNAFILRAWPTRPAARRARRIASSPPATIAGRSTASRSRSRTCSTSRGLPTTAASRVREGHVARKRRAGHRASAPGRRRVRRQDQPSRVRVRHDERGLGVRPGAQSVTTRHDRPAARAADRRRASPPAWRSPRSAPTPADRSAFPPRHAASSV